MQGGMSIEHHSQGSCMDALLPHTRNSQASWHLYNDGMLATLVKLGSPQLTQANYLKYTQNSI